MNEFSEDVKVYKAFCDENRLKIIDLLSKGEQCACALKDAIGIAQSSLSYHMKILCESGIVYARHDGKWTRYTLNNEGIQYASKRLLEITTLKREKVGCCKKSS